MADARPPLQTEVTLGGHHGIAGHLWAHLMKGRQDGAYGFAPRPLKPSDGDATQVDSDVLGMACQTPAATAGRLGGTQLTTKGEKERQPTYDTRSALGEALNVGRFVVKIDGDGAVGAGLVDGGAPGLPAGQRRGAAGVPRWG